jgi:hypothetical protein
MARMQVKEVSYYPERIDECQILHGEQEYTCVWRDGDDLEISVESIYPDEVELEEGHFNEVRIPEDVLKQIVKSIGLYTKYK